MATELSDVVSLYVGNLDESVKEDDLYEVFNGVSAVFSVRVCRDQLLNHSLGYAYVNFKTTEESVKAKELLNFKPLKGKPMRIMFSQHNLNHQENYRANVFVKNLDRSIDDEILHSTFSGFGNVLSCKVSLESSGQSRGFGFVQFEHESEADEAIKKLNGAEIKGKQVYVGLFIRQQDRLGSAKVTNVYVKNLSESDSDENLKELFGSFGEITSAAVMRDEQGKSKGFGFVNFASPEAASEAMGRMNGVQRGGTVLFAGPAMKKDNREAELKRKFEEEKEKLKGANLYVKNVDDCVDGDEKLKDIFSPFGTITSCKLAKDAQGKSKGYGFVAFATSEEALKAMKELNRKIVGRKPLYVAIAQLKEERKALMEAQRAAPQPPNPDFLPGPSRRPVFLRQWARPSMMAPPLPRFGLPRPVMMPQPFHQQWQPPRGSRFLPFMRPRGPVRPQKPLASSDPESGRTMMGDQRLYPMVERMTRPPLEMELTEVMHRFESAQVLHSSALPKSVGGINQ